MNIFNAGRPSPEYLEIKQLKQKNAKLLDVVQELESAVLAAHNLIEVEQFCAAKITIKRANDGIWERREAIAKAGGEA